MLTNQELRQAAFALNIIKERGDRHVFEAILSDANKAAPAGDGWDNLTLGRRLNLTAEADALSRLLGEPVERCETAVLDVFGPGRARLRFKAIVDYAIELFGPCRELTGESLFSPYNTSAAVAAPAIPRPYVSSAPGEIPAVIAKARRKAR